MSIEIEFKGHGGGVGIEVLGYENPDAENGSDANWLVCRVNVGVGPFGGEMMATFTAQDFAAFASELGDLLEHRAEGATFDTDEQALTLKVEMGPTGVARISGVARYVVPEVTVSFTVESDQSYLTGAARALADVTKRFPVRR